MQHAHHAEHAPWCVLVRLPTHSGCWEAHGQDCHSLGTGIFNSKIYIYDKNTLFDGKTVAIPQSPNMARHLVCWRRHSIAQNHAKIRLLASATSQCSLA